MLKKTYIIAEAGVNHNGSLEMAKELVDVAAISGADAVKFQTFNAKKLVSYNAPKADYQNHTTDASESQLDMIQKLELNEQDHQILIDYCHQKNISFLSTPFDLDSVDLLAKKFDLPRIKISSGDVTNAPLLFKIAQTQKSVILSTGMCSLADIETALGVLALGYTRTSQVIPSLLEFSEAYSSQAGQKALKEKVVILHCTTEYPAPLAEINLHVMDTLHIAFGLPVGYSDHTKGINVSLAAVARGAVILEKHFTLDKTLPGPDHQASLDPTELKTMIQGIREIEQALGSGLKTASSSEIKNKPIARKSLVAGNKIDKGAIFTEDNLATKRPGTGISPIYYWEWLGKRAERAYQADEVISS